MIFVKRKCWILTFKVGYTFLQDTLYYLESLFISQFYQSTYIYIPGDCPFYATVKVFL